MSLPHPPHRLPVGPGAWLSFELLSRKLEKNSPAEKPMAVSFAVQLTVHSKGDWRGTRSGLGTQRMMLGWCCTESLKPVKQHWFRSAGDLFLTLLFALFHHQSDKHRGAISAVAASGTPLVRL